MTVKQLIKLLKEQEPDAEVVLAANYGDRGRTMQAIEIESVDEETLVESAYSDSGWKVVRGEGSWDEAPDNARTAVVLS